MGWKMAKVDICPRCGEKTLERFDHHSSCLECQYSPDLDGWIEIDSKFSMSNKRNEENEINLEMENFYE